MSNEPQQQRHLTFEKAKAVADAIDALDIWRTHIVSAGNKEQPAYTVELHMGGIDGERAAALQGIAERHHVPLSFSVEADGNPILALRATFDRSGRWYAEGHHHRLPEGAS